GGYRVPTSDLPDLSIVLTFLRRGQGWSQAELAAAAGFSPNLVSEYERGSKNLLRSRLEHLIGFMGLLPERIDATLACLAENRAAGRPPAAPGTLFAAERRRVESLSSRVSGLASVFTRSALSLLTVEGEALRSRQWAEQLWAQ